MIKFSNVSLVYPTSTQTILEGLSFSIEEGEMVLVIGSTGTGKSSLLRLINGLVPHHTGGILAGDVTVDGISTQLVRPGELAHLIGIVGQNPSSGFVTDTVEEELVFGMESLNIAPDVMRKRVEEILDLFDSLPNTLVGKFFSGIIPLSGLYFTNAHSNIPGPAELIIFNEYKTYHFHGP